MRIFIEPLHILKKDGYRMKIQFDFIADVLISATGESDVNAVYCDECMVDPENDGTSV